MQTSKEEFVDELEHHVRDLTIMISAAEGWATGYMKTPAVFQQLLVYEAQFEQIMRNYFLGLSKRVANYVDWHKYTVTVLEAYEVNVMLNKQQFNDSEQTQLDQIISEIYVNGVALGIQAAYERAKAAGQLTEGEVELMPGSPIDEAVQHVIHTEVGKLAKGLDQTTITAIQDSISQSLAMGETKQQAIDRLMSNIESMSESRATTIARTETVRAHQMGRNQFAQANGALTKTWNALPGADEGDSETPCLDNDGETVNITEDFASGDAFPPAHPNCRCDVDYVYTNAKGADEDLGGDIVDEDPDISPAEIE